MQSALIVHSNHTEKYAKKLSKEYKKVEFLNIKNPPTEKNLDIKTNKDIVIGIGGGSVIDTAKIIARDKRCVAIPTTAAGAAMTPYATVWGREKISVPTKIPILKMDYKMPKDLPFSARQSTTFDALSHAIESFWSKNATLQSKNYSKKAIYLINKYLDKFNHHLSKNNINKLITAGNLAGQAIAIAKTNVVHAASYPITIEYEIDHGTACGMLLPYFVAYMDFEGLPELFNLNSTKELVIFLEENFIVPKIEKINIELVVNEILKYDKINKGSKIINKKSLIRILKDLENEEKIS